MDYYLAILLAILCFITVMLLAVRVFQKKDYTIIAAIMARFIYIITTIFFIQSNTISHNAIGWSLSGIFIADMVISLGYILSKKYRMIIENARLQKILEDMKYKYKVLLETMPIGVYVLDEEGKIEFVNEYLLNLGGYEMSDLLYRPIINFVADEDKEKVLESIRERFSKELISDSYCINIIKKDKSLVKVKIRSNLTTNGHPTITGSVIPEDILSCEE